MNKFFKMSLKALTLPMFVIRVINGALIRYIPSIFMLHFYILGEPEVQDSKGFWILVGIISLVWSFLYAVSTPSVPRIAYMYRNYPPKLRSILKKRIAFWIALVLLGIVSFITVAELPLYLIICFWYVLSSVTINIMLMMTVSSMGYNPFFEELCYKNGGAYENKTVSQIYNESGMSKYFSKDGLKQTANELKSDLKDKKR